MEEKGPLEATWESHSITCAAWIRDQSAFQDPPRLGLEEAQTLALDGRSCRESVAICCIRHRPSWGMTFRIACFRMSS